MMPGVKVEIMKTVLEDSFPSAAKPTSESNFDIDEKSKDDNEIYKNEGMIDSISKETLTVDDNSSFEIQDLFGYCCFICRKSLRNKNDLKDHIEECHSEADIAIFGVDNLEKYLKSLHSMSTEQVSLRYL